MEIIELFPSTKRYNLQHSSNHFGASVDHNEPVDQLMYFISQSLTTRSKEVKILAKYD